MDKPQKIRLETAQKAGIDINFETMPNGERRYRLVATDGSSYCRTEASETGAWQNSHYHKKTCEFYVVQSGWIVYATLDAKKQHHLHFLQAGASVTVTPPTPHNIYLSANAIIHTIKYSQTSQTIDWFASEELDFLVKKLSKEELLHLTNAPFN